MTKGSPSREDKRYWNYRPRAQSKQRKNPLCLLYKLEETSVHKQGKRWEECQKQWIIKAALRLWFTAKVNALYQGSPTPSGRPVAHGLLGTLLQAKCLPTTATSLHHLPLNQSLVPKGQGPDPCSTSYNWRTSLALIHFGRSQIYIIVRLFKILSIFLQINWLTLFM